MPKYNGWEPLRDDGDPQGEKMLGSGGQGVVYLARSPKRVQQINEGAERMKKLLRAATASVDQREVDFPELAEMIVEIGGSDPVNHLGALKQFKIPVRDQDEASRARGRLESEVRALQALDEHPAVLKLLDQNVEEHFIVTEYHMRGTLDKQLKLFKGDALGALEAFKPLVDGVSRIHEQRMIHRDIKPENIFVAASGNLVLGDFGIVFFQDGSERLTTTYERVGSHDWMAPWAYKKAKLEFSKINPALDIFPLAKVLWSMISGENGFPFWEYDRGENNLEKLFPDDPLMRLVNGVLATCIVRDEKDCTSSALDLGSQVDALINQIKEGRGHKPVPPGTINAFGGGTEPPGWLWCDGGAISRTVYVDLFDSINTIYGIGDGQSTFNVPDLRGCFLRGLDRGAGVDKDRMIGSIQGHLVGPHRHWLAKGGDVQEGNRGKLNEFTRNKDWPGDHYTDDDNHPHEGIGAETRPINVAINWIIKY